MSLKYKCPECESIHEDFEWTNATLEDAEGPVMPLEVADDGDYIYTCPTCWEVISNKDLHVVVEQSV
jgi:DNA-directed RNA polymerase subunit RPC12/RpoP